MPDIFLKGRRLVMDAFIEFISDFTQKLSQFSDITAAAALIIIDICALAVILYCLKEKKSVQSQWSKASRHMVLTDGAESFIFTLNAQEILLGRHISADLRFPDMSVSRYHALLSLNDGIWTIKDLDSKTGTYVNGAKITERKLKNNDEIVIGKKRIYIRRVKL